MRLVTLAATQFTCSWDLSRNAASAERVTRAAAAQGARIILLQELFTRLYFCITQNYSPFGLAQPFENHPLLARFADLACELGVVLPVTFFEMAGQAHFNTCAMIDADGTILGQ